MSIRHAGLYGPEAILGQTGTPATTTSVTVYLHGTTTAATLYTSATKTTTATNPVKTDSFGNLAFYAAPTLYTLSFTVGGVNTTKAVVVAPWFSDSSVMTGDIKPTAIQAVQSATLITTAWLLCDGSAVSRTTYSALYTALGSASSPWGQGDGSTTFNVPDFRGRALVGHGTVNTTGQPTIAIGGTGGSANHILTTAQLPAHNHAVTDPEHDHKTYANNTNYQAIYTDATVSATKLDKTGSGTNVTYNATNVTQKAATGVTTKDTGTGTAVSLMQPYAGVQWLIKV